MHPPTMAVWAKLISLSYIGNVIKRLISVGNVALKKLDITQDSKVIFSIASAVHHKPMMHANA